jgi:hypothetical protein
MGGGGSKQETQSDVVTNLMSKVCTKATQKCVNMSASEQTAKIGPMKNSTISNITMVQQVTVSMNCKFDAQAIASLQDAIANELSSTTGQTSQAVLGALNAMSGEKSNTLQVSSIKTQIQKEINNEFLSEVANIVNSSQKIEIASMEGSTLKNLSMEQSVSVVQNAFAQVLGKTDLITAIKNEDKKESVLDQRNPISDTITAVSGLVDGALKGASSLIGSLNITVFIFAIVVCVILYLFKDTIADMLPVNVVRGIFGNKLQEKAYPQPPPYQPPQSYQPNYQPLQYYPEQSYYQQPQPSVQAFPVTQPVPNAPVQPFNLDDTPQPLAPNLDSPRK